MPRFEVKDADGKRYEITAPDMKSAMSAWQTMQQQQTPVHHGNILPIDRDSAGGLHLNWNSGLTGMIGRTFSLPGEVYRGEIPTQTPTGPAPELMDRAAEAAATILPVNPAVRAGERAIPGVMQAMRREQVAAPSQQALKAATDAGYEQARGLGVDYTGSSVARMTKILKVELGKRGILPEDAPSTYKKLDMLANPPEGANSSFVELESARKAFGNVAQDFKNPTDQLAARAAIKAIDYFFENPTPASVLAGPAAAIGELSRAARGNAAAGFRSKEIVGRANKAIRRTAATNSGQNLDNKLRQRVADLLDSPKLSSGFSPEEIKLLNEFVDPGFGMRNTARYTGKALGGGGGLGMYITGIGGSLAGGAASTAIMGSPIGFAIGAGLPAVGFGATRLANVLAKRDIRALDEIIRSRSPLMKEMQKNAPASAVSPEGRAVLMRGLLAPTQSSQGGGGW